MPALAEIARNVVGGIFRQRQSTWEELTDPQKWPPREIKKNWDEQNSTAGARIDIIKSHYEPNEPFNIPGVAEVVGDFVRKDLVTAAIDRSKIVHKDFYIEAVRLRTEKDCISHAIAFFGGFSQFSDEQLQAFLEAAGDAARAIHQIWGLKLEKDKAQVRIRLANPIHRMDLALSGE